MSECEVELTGSEIINLRNTLRTLDSESNGRGPEFDGELYLQLAINGNVLRQASQELVQAGQEIARSVYPEGDGREPPENPPPNVPPEEAERIRARRGEFNEKWTKMMGVKRKLRLHRMNYFHFRAQQNKIKISLLEMLLAHDLLITTDPMPKQQDKPNRPPTPPNGAAHSPHDPPRIS